MTPLQWPFLHVKPRLTGSSFILSLQEITTQKQKCTQTEIVYDRTAKQNDALNADVLLADFLS